MTGLPHFILFISSCLLLLSAADAQNSPYSPDVPRWQWESYPGHLANGDVGQYLNLSSGVDLWYTTFGNSQSNNTPVLFLHGGTANSNMMFNQANYLSKTRTVILQDTRGQGRSPYTNFTTFHYDDFTRDAIAVLDHLNVSKVAVVGWSDGAITGLELAMKYPARITRVFAHGANIQADQNKPGKDDPITASKSGTLDIDADSDGTMHAKRHTLTKRDDPVEDGCKMLSPTPDKCSAMIKAVSAMQGSEPTWGRSDLAKIKCPLWSVIGDHDIAVQRNQADAIAAWTPFAGQLVLPQVGHEALLQDATAFNFMMGYFLDMQYDGVMPYY